MKEVCYNNVRRTKGHKSQYKGVSRCQNKKTGEYVWQGTFYYKGSQNSKFYETEREAAKAVDLFKINHGLEPVNILVRK